jgi:hypothetical protein
MKKRITALVLALALWVTLVPMAGAVSTGYTDVPETHWAADSVRRATSLGLFQGVGNGKFGLGQTMTRAAFVTALVRLFNWEEVTPAKATFTDVGAWRWYYTAVETAAANGALTTSSKTFRPQEAITREEMATMLVRALGYASLAGTVSSYQSPFSDVTTNRGFITVAYDFGIVTGVGNGKFKPSATATREQAAAVLVRVYDKLGASVNRLSSAGGYRQIRVTTPSPSESDTLPTTPLEPISELYDQLRSLSSAGADMSRAVLCLTEGGVRTIVSGGRILSCDALTADQVSEILTTQSVHTYYSTRYESAYCTYRPNDYQSVTVWYQNEKSMNAKLQLAKLFGVTRYVLE